VKGKWSANTIMMTDAWLDQGLKKRCITRDLKWGTPVPLDGFRDKVFYVWFDAPIGYISITAGYTKDWRAWWQNPKDVDLVQFMGKDNVPFHTVIFPSSLIGTGRDWTLVHHVSTTEYLNYETGKFSKSRGTGVFGDSARDCGLPSDCFRYYLLANRPEVSDSVFSWLDFGGKINGELLNNLGNFFNRTLKFVKEKLEGLLPVCEDAELTEGDLAFVKSIDASLQAYRAAMDEVHLKKGLSLVMEASAAANKFSQDMKSWDLLKTSPARCNVVMALLTRCVFLIASMAEPFLPTIAGKVFEQMNCAPERLPLSFTGIRSVLKDLPAGHAIGEPVALVPQVKQPELDALSSKFSGPKVVPFPLELKVGQITAAKEHEGADTLYVLTVAMSPAAVAGEASGSSAAVERTIVSALRGVFKTAADLVGRKVVVLCNLKPRAFVGVQSHGMLLTGVSAAGEVVLLSAETAQPGSAVLPEGTEYKPRPKPLELKHFQELDLTIGANGQALYNKELVLKTGGETVSAPGLKEGLIK
jgi:methionyl-tRNA synthetase